jgi:hypothetical protein
VPNFTSSVQSLSPLCLCGDKRWEILTTEAQRTRRLHRGFELGHYQLPLSFTFDQARFILAANRGSKTKYLLVEDG